MKKQNIISGVALYEDDSDIDDDSDVYQALRYSLTSDGELFLLSNEHVPIESADDYIHIQDLDFHTAIVTPSVEYLHYGCLANCKNLHKVVLSEELRSVDADIVDSSPVEYFIENGLKFLGTEGNPRYALMGFACGVSREKLVIPEGTVLIAGFAFLGRQDLREVVFPRSLVSFGLRTFGKTPAEHLYIPDGTNLDPRLLEEICLVLFDGLKSVSVPYSFYQYYLAQKGVPSEDFCLPYGEYPDCEVIFRNLDGSIAETVRGPETKVDNEPDSGSASELPLNDDGLPF